MAAGHQWQIQHHNMRCSCNHSRPERWLAQLSLFRSRCSSGYASCGELLTQPLFHFGHQTIISSTVAGKADNSTYFDAMTARGQCKPDGIPRNVPSLEPLANLRFGTFTVDASGKGQSLRSE